MIKQKNNQIKRIIENKTDDEDYTVTILDNYLDVKVDGYEIEVINAADKFRNKNNQKSKGKKSISFITYIFIFKLFISNKLLNNQDKDENKNNNKDDEEEYKNETEEFEVL